MIFERMLDKQNIPSIEAIQAYMGHTSYDLMCSLEKHMEQCYDLQKELRFPFGNHYGWGYKYSHKRIHLCYVFFERNACTIMIQIGDRGVEQLEAVFDTLSDKAKALWHTRYPCGERGGWVNLRMMEQTDMDDVLLFLNAKKKFARIT